MQPDPVNLTAAHNALTDFQAQRLAGEAVTAPLDHAESAMARGDHAAALTALDVALDALDLDDAQPAPRNPEALQTRAEWLSRALQLTARLRARMGVQS